MISEPITHAMKLSANVKYDGKRVWSKFGHKSDEARGVAPPLKSI